MKRRLRQSIFTVKVQLLLLNKKGYSKDSSECKKQTAFSIILRRATLICTLTF